MLQSFNDRLKGPFTWIIVITVSFVFVITGMSFLFTGGGSGRSYIAKIGDNEISSQQFQQYSQGATTEVQKRQVLDQMVSQYLIFADAQKHDLQVPKLALQSAIFTNPMFFADDGKFSADKLSEVANYVGGMPRLEAMLSQNIIAGTIPNAIQSTAFITKDENALVDSAYAVSKSVEYVKYSPKALESEVKPTNEELQKYFTQHRAQYVNPAKASISYFVITKDDFKSNDKITDEQIQEYYNENKDLFKNFDDKAKASIKSIIQNRKALTDYNSYIQDIDGMKFANLTKKMGKAKTANITNNVDSTEGVKNSLFFINKDKQAAIAVDQDKTLVYQVDKLTPESPQKFDEVKSEVTQAYTYEKAKDLAVEKAEQTLASLNKNAKATVSFEKAEVTSDYTGLPKDFVSYIIGNANQEYLLYKDQDDNTFVYKVTAVKPLKDTKGKVSSEVSQNYKQEELNYYLQTVRAEVPVKINAQNI
ncbi:peptidylprolyl isomerase [Francisellaceae bacterium CB300]